MIAKFCEYITKFCEKITEIYEMYGLWVTLSSILVALVLVFGSLCLCGWLLMVVLYWFNISLSFWWCFAIASLVNVIIKLIEIWAKGEKL